MKPKLFIGSSVEALPIARAIHENLDYDADITIWTENVFKLTSNALDDLIKASEDFNFGIFVFNPDDLTEVNNIKHNTVRDNVIFELGLFIGKLGKDKVFFVIPKSGNLKLPTDLLGVTPGKYDDKRADNNLNAALTPFCNQIRDKIKSYHYEDLIDFDKESKRARQLASEKKTYWEHLLTAELLKTRFRETDKSLYDLENGLYFHRSIVYDYPNFLEFVGLSMRDTSRLLGILTNLFQIELEKSWGEIGTAGNVNEIKHTCDKISTTLKEILYLEYKFLSAHPPEGLNEPLELLRGWCINLYKEFRRLPEILEDAVVSKQNNVEPTVKPISSIAMVDFEKVNQLLLHYDKSN